METFRFWESWPRVYKNIGLLVAFLFFFSFIILWIYRYEGNSAILHWQKRYDQQVIDPVVHSFSKGPFTFSIPGEAYITFEYYNGSAIQPNHTASYIFLFVLMSAAVILISVITTLERFWFLVGTALVILFIISLRPEVLQLMGSESRLPTIILVAVYTFTAFYFNTLKPSTGFLIRLLVFALLSGLFLLAVHYLSAVHFPLLHLSVTGYTAGLVLTVIFVLMIAHEIPAFFIYLSSQETSKSLRQFSIISLIYLINLMVTYLHEIGSIDWNIFIGAYVLLSISAILGIWGFRHRESIYGNIILFSPFGACFYLSLGAIALITTAAMLGTGNDSALLVIREAIIFGHLGYGIIFLTYVISNFILPMAQNLPVYKVLYKPNRMPYVTYRIAGMIAVLAFVFYSGWKPYVYYGMSGFYNSIGDLYVTLDRNAFAEAYYKQGADFGFLNHHSNYALATMAMRRNDVEKAVTYFDNANQKDPSAYAASCAANLELRGNPVEGIRSYHEGLKKVPESAELQNNLGYAYAKSHMVDSAVYMFDQATRNTATRETARINFLALAAMEYLPLRADSTLQTLDPENAAMGANALAMALQNRQTFNLDVHPLEQTHLDLSHATLLNNYIVRNINKLDTLFLNKVLLLATDSMNDQYSEALKATLAQGYYEQGLVYKAFDLMGEVAFVSSSRSGQYNYIMGLWALEQDNAELAARNFSAAAQNDYKKALVYEMLALAEAGHEDEAVRAADSVISTGDAADSVVAAQLESYYALKSDQVLSSDDDTKYSFCHYMFRPRDTIRFKLLARTIISENHQALTYLEMAKKAFDRDEIKTAISYYNEIRKLHVTDGTLNNNIMQFRLELLVTLGDTDGVEQMIATEPQIAKNSPHGMLGRAFVLESKGDTTAARLIYDRLARLNPYFETGIIEASRFFEFRELNHLRSYGILADAIQVNDVNIRLLIAYITQASRVGLDRYADGARLRVNELLKD